MLGLSRLSYHLMLKRFFLLTHLMFVLIDVVQEVATQTCNTSGHLPFVSSGGSSTEITCRLERLGLCHHQQCFVRSHSRCSFCMYIHCFIGSIILLAYIFDSSDSFLSEYPFLDRNWLSTRKWLSR